MDASEFTCKLSKPLVFASCNRQNRPQGHWPLISSQLHKEGHSPIELFFWTGDAVYAKDNSLSALEAALLNMTQQFNYTNFLEETELGFADGVWDDHDYGINDSGALPDRDARASLYTEFLRTNTKSEKKTKGKSQLEWLDQVNERGGMYHSRVIDRSQEPGGGTLKLIFLDTRYNRQKHYIRSLGEIHFPLIALIAAALRVTYSFLGLGASWSGQMLGERQWIWLEEELASSDADFHIVVSSVQVLTTNPAVESWGHFPLEKQRLLRLLARTDPRGLLLLSGDVHHAEVSTAVVDHVSTASGALTQVGTLTEVTSSGLTHTCGDGLLTSLLCPLMLRTFDRHRRDDNARQEGLRDVPEIPEQLCNEPPSAWHDTFYIGRNYGQIQFDRDSLEVSVRALESGQVVLKRQLQPDVLLPTRGAETGGQLRVRVTDFYRLPRDASKWQQVAVIVLCPVLVFAMLRSCWKLLRLLFGRPHGVQCTRAEEELTAGSSAHTNAAEESRGFASESDPGTPEGFDDDWVPCSPSKAILDDDDDDDHESHPSQRSMKGWSPEPEGLLARGEIQAYRKRLTTLDGRPLTKRLVLRRNGKWEAQFLTRKPRLLSLAARSLQATGNGQETQRLFFSVSLPYPAQQQLWGYTKAFACAVKDGRLSASACPLETSWVPPRNYHITLRFLGDVRINGIHQLATSVRRVLRSYQKTQAHLLAPFDATVGGCFGAFPEPQQPRVLWAAVGAACQRHLSALAGVVDDACLQVVAEEEALAQLSDLGFEEEADQAPVAPPQVREGSAHATNTHATNAILSPALVDSLRRAERNAGGGPRYTPHVTVARCQPNKQYESEDADFAQAHALDPRRLLLQETDQVSFRVDSFALVCSRLAVGNGEEEAKTESQGSEYFGRSGSVYETVAKFNL